MITHKVKEARQVGDRLTVLRGGKSLIEGVAPTSIDDELLVATMVGREVPPLPSERERASISTVALEVSGLVVPGDAGRSGISGLDLQVLAGEVMGIAGVAGSGQLELADALAGIGTVKSGTICVSGRAVKSAEPRAVLAAGIVSVPEDPVSQWVIYGLNVVEHVALSLVRGWIDRGEHRRRFGIDWSEVRKTVKRLDEKAELRMAAPHRQVATLSGGNIQRVLLTQVLGTEAAVYVLAYPNRGLDIASARQVHELIMRRRAAGAAVILISEDLDELISVCDRIAVLHNGKLSGVREAHATDRSELGHLMLVEVA
jgi:simple sugar transport system ATP-binding protein